MSDPRVHRYIRMSALAGEAQLRTASYDDQEYIVMPVIALIGDAVVRPMNSEGPEFVPAEELAMAPSSWDSRPILPDHPHGGRATANTPQTLEAERYGWMFNTRFIRGKLETEAWLDPARAERIGGDAKRVLDIARRAMAGEEVDPVEVSVGAWVSLERVNGQSPSGLAYEYRWSRVVPDHLAVGLNGAEGACSTDMGCGGPRVAKGCHCNQNEDTDTEPATAQLRAAEDKDSNMSKTREPANDFRSNAEGIGLENLREILEEALNDIHETAQYVYVMDIYDDVAVYRVHYDDQPSELLERGYTLDEQAETVELAEEAIEVVRKVSYEPVPQEEPTTAKSNQTSFMDTLKRLLGFRSAEDHPEGMSDVDLFNKLTDALRADEPGFQGLVEFFPSDEIVIYMAMPEDRMLILKRKYELNENKEVALAEERVEVEPVLRYEEVTRASAESKEAETESDLEAAADVADGDNETGDGADAARTQDERTDMSKTTEEVMKGLVGRLIAAEKSPYSGDDEAALLERPQEELEALEEAFTDSPEAEAPVEPNQPAEAAPEDGDAEATPEEEAEEKDTVQLSREEYEDIRAAAQCHKRQRQEQKDALVSQLSEAQDGYTDKQLAAKDLEELQALSRALRLDEQQEEVLVRDYSGRGAPKAASNEERSAPPKPWTAALKAKNGAVSKEVN